MINPMLWVGYPRSYTPGRRMRPKLLVIHYTAGSEGPTSAENGAYYDKIRTDGTSCHAFFDSQGPGLQEVPFGDRSHSAFFHGNEIGVHMEICGTRQTRAQWLDGTSLATLTTCAQATAYACATLGIPTRRITVEETRAAYYSGGPGGICDHWDVTRAFPEDPGTHTDVGPEFPWDLFMPMVGQYSSTGGDMATTFDTPYVGADGQARTHAQLLQNLHDDWFFARYQTPTWPKSVQNRLAQLLARPLAEVTDEQVAAIAAELVQAVVDAPDNPLSEADMAAVAAVAERVLAAQAEKVRVEIRDAVADGLEGGSSAVRADVDEPSPAPQ